MIHVINELPHHSFTKQAIVAMRYEHALYLSSVLCIMNYLRSEHLKVSYIGSIWKIQIPLQVEANWASPPNGSKSRYHTYRLYVRMCPENRRVRSLSRLL